MANKDKNYKMYRIYEYEDNGCVYKRRYKDLRVAMDRVQFLVGLLGKYSKISKSTLIKIELYEKDGGLVREWAR